MANYTEIELPGPSQVAIQLIRNTLWSRLPRKSIITGLWLRDFEGTSVFNNCFLWVLPIKDFPYFKYYFKNIVLVTPGELALWQQCTEEERIQYSLSIEEQSKGTCTANWAVLKTLDEELRKEHHKCFPVTYRGIVGYQYSLEQQKQIVGHLNKKFLSESK